MSDFGYWFQYWEFGKEYRQIRDRKQKLAPYMAIDKTLEREAVWF